MNPLYAFRVYLDTNMLRIFLLGFSSGLPFPLVVGTLSFWLREEGVSKTDIGLFALVGTPWVIKFLWAPIVDQLSIPYLTRRLGSRRSWILLSQCGLIASIIALGSSDPTTNLWWMAFFALCVSTCSATQDIGIDAYRIEALQQDQQGAGAAAIVFGWRIGALVSGAAPFFVASQTSWFVAYLCMALLMGLGIITMIFSREPDIHGDYTAKSWEDWIKHAVINPFTEFMTRQRWLLILVFIILYKLGDAIALTMLSPFAVDLGFSKDEYAAIVKVYGVFATLAGAFIGGALLSRTGIIKGLLICGVLQMCSTLAFIWQAHMGHHLGALTITISLENFASGMGTTAFVAYLSALCNAKFTATQYALFSALASVGRTWFSASSGYMADSFGYETFFLICALLAIPGLICLHFLKRTVPN